MCVCVRLFVCVLGLYIVLRVLSSLQSSSCADPEGVPGQVTGGGGLDPAPG